MTNPSKHEGKREHNRRTAYIVAEYTVKEGIFRDIIKNIGARGIFIGTQRLIADGQEIVLKFPLFSFEHVMQVKGHVVRSGPFGFAVNFDSPIDGLICKNGEFPEIVHEIDRNTTD